MKKLKVLAISDLHLGEPEGLLNNRGVNITDVVTNKVAELAKGDGDFEDGIEELILIGDIADLSEATKEEAYTNTKTFLTSLLEKVQIDKVLYISGNHDHHLWVEMLKTYKGKNCYKECVPKTGVVIKKPKLLMEKCFPPDYKGEVEAHYPFYLLNINSSYFLFDHGHLFSSLLNKLAKRAGTVTSLDDMENKTYEFMELLWFKGESSFWIRFNNLREKCYDWGRWISDRTRHVSRGASFKEDSTPVYDDSMRDNIIKYLGTLIGIDNSKMDDFHLVFGHTHYGGRVLRDDRKIRLNGRFITLWNTGGWLVPSEIFSPDAYLFYIEQTHNGPIPKAYKLVAKKENEEGDYDRGILGEVVKNIGKTS
jgi:hypothetical protein